MDVPGTADRTPSDLVMARSAWGVSVSLSVALLLPGLGSVTPGGGATVAVLSRLPVAAGSIWTVKVKLTVAPTGRPAVAASAPLPPPGPRTAAPPVALANAQLPPVAPAGSRSDTLAPLTALGPALLTTMV